jgi:cytochrome P450
MTTALACPFAAVGAGERMAIYQRLAAAEPVHRVALPDGSPAWLVTGLAEARQVMTDPRLVKLPSLFGAQAELLPAELARGLNSHMLLADGAGHARLRRLVGAAFTARGVARLTPRIQQITNGLLDDLAGRGECDLIAEFAYPLPMTVICELIGVPEADRADFHTWTTTVLAAGFVTDDAWLPAAAAEVRYVRALVEAKRRHPRDDLLSALVAVRDGDDVLSEDELTSMVFILVAAGHETTVNLIGNGMHALLTNPTQLVRLRAEPALVPTAVEELLRFASPAQVTAPMIATEAVQVGDTHIEPGELVVPGLIAANHDPARIDDPIVLDIGRAPNPHIAFGHGIHHCLGAPLARLEGRIALGSLLARFPRIRLAVPAEQLTWQPTFLIHGLTELPVTLR